MAANCHMVRSRAMMGLNGGCGGFKAVVEAALSFAADLRPEPSCLPLRGDVPAEPLCAAPALDGPANPCEEAAKFEAADKAAARRGAILAEASASASAAA